VPGGVRGARLNPGGRGVLVIALVAVVAAVTAGVFAWRARPAVQPVAAVPEPVAASPSESAPLVVVAVAGKVRRPGLVRLPSGSRVADAIAAAGGVLPGADPGLVNLARKVVDGEQIVVGVAAAPAAGTGAAPGSVAAPGQLINLNTATAEQLDALPGVGPVLAQRIVDHRTAHGSFRAVDELREVDGIGETRFQRLKKLVTV
jgi:competence protein ComEA